MGAEGGQLGCGGEGEGCLGAGAVEVEVLLVAGVVLGEDLALRGEEHDARDVAPVRLEPAQAAPAALSARTAEGGPGRRPGPGLGGGASGGRRAHLSSVGSSSSWTLIITKLSAISAMRLSPAKDGPRRLHAPHQLLCTTTMASLFSALAASRPSSRFFHSIASPNPAASGAAPAARRQRRCPASGAGHGAGWGEVWLLLVWERGWPGAPRPSSLAAAGANRAAAAKRRAARIVAKRVVWCGSSGLATATVAWDEAKI